MLQNNMSSIIVAPLSCERLVEIEGTNALEGSVQAFPDQLLAVNTETRTRSPPGHSVTMLGMGLSLLAHTWPPVSPSLICLVTPVTEPQSIVRHLAWLTVSTAH